MRPVIPNQIGHPIALPALRCGDDNALHFEIWPEDRTDVPLHLRLAPPDAVSPVYDRHAQNPRGLSATALLDAVGVAGLVDVEAGVKWFH